MPKNAGTLCRSAEYECDLPEYCTGQSEYCPTDIYKMDTEVCENGKVQHFHSILLYNRLLFIIYFRHTVIMAFAVHVRINVNCCGAKLVNLATNNAMK